MSPILHDLPARRTRKFAIYLRRSAPREILVSAELDGTTIAAEAPVALSTDFYFSYADFVRSRGIKAQNTNRSPDAEALRDLHRLGDAVGQMLFHDKIAHELSALLQEATKENQIVDLSIETGDQELLAIPFEAARLPDHRVPALEPGVRMVRRLTGHNNHVAPLPGPLKILVAVGAPDEGKTPNTVLDVERELQCILNAVEKARRDRGAYVRILDVGHPEEIRRALQEQAYHVLHLSGHGREGLLELEDEDGGPVLVTAEQLTRAIRESGHHIPLVFLASCLSGAGDSETVGLAQGLLQHGIPAVMAMQTSVLDSYATQLAEAFYENLSLGERPLASAALALARQKLESERRRAAEIGDYIPPEYATPSLFFAGNEVPIVDTAESQPPVEQTRRLSPGIVPMLRMDDLIGRRQELRRIMRVLTDEPSTIESVGRKAGVQVTGIGGVGKSSLVGRAMTRMADQSWICVAITGQWTLGELAATISAGLIESADPRYKETGQSLADEKLADQVRFKLICGLLAKHPLLLVLDNFEDNLIVGGERFLDVASAKVMEILYQSAQHGKLLITSRYPLPESEDWLATEQLGPLTDAQTRKLLLRLSGLRDQQAEGLEFIRRVIGGHPRMLEYLDAILRQGKARLPDVARRLREQAKKQGIDLEKSAATLEDAVETALQVGAGDILLDELLRLAANHPGDPEVLHQAAVFPRPVSLEGLAFCLNGACAPEKEQITQARAAAARLSHISLLTRFPDGDVWVHRWTANTLHERDSEKAYRECCRRAAEYLTSSQRSVGQGLEATRLFLQAQEFDRAAEEGQRITVFLRNYGHTTDLAEVAGEFTESFPETHPKQYIFLGVEAEALAQLGLGQEALARYQQIARILQARVQINPNTDTLRGLSVTYNKMGDLLLKQGHAEQTRDFFQRSLEIMERLTVREPHNIIFQSDLSISYSRMGALLYHLGQKEQARSFFQKDVEISEQLAVENPDNTDIQEGFAASCNNMGGVLLVLGHLEQAHGFLQKAMELYEWLAEQKPGNISFRYNLGIAYKNMGVVVANLGNPEQARPFFQRAMHLREQLAEQEPDRIDFLRDLSISYDDMGKLMLGLGESEQAQAFFQKALAVRERLTEQAPDRADLQFNLVMSLVGIADRASLEKALAIMEKLDREGQLSPDQRNWLDTVRKMLEELNG